MAKLLDPQQSYTFSKIFELRPELDRLVNELGYVLQRVPLALPTYTGVLDRLDNLYQRLEEILPYVNLANEDTRREVLISPIIMEVVHYTHAQLRIEYPVKVSDQLQGYVDYLLRTQSHLIVIEAKQEDMTNGFTQLAMEMIALDQWSEMPNQRQIIGAVTTGNLWQFGRLDRSSKVIEQGLNSYRVTEDLEPLLRVLIYCLRNGS
jgi:Type I restriction enzyme R protein N terminus (HSDR_N)